jgi:mRNA-degrading endonuclease toxin of MazEF toxin-antitoxin module
VDRQRLINRLGVIDPTTMARVNQAIQISLGLIDV